MDILSRLNFNGSEEYKEAEMRPWIIQGEEFGQVKKSNKLTFLRVDNAGHEVVLSAPKKAIKLFESWISNRTF